MSSTAFSANAKLWLRTPVTLLYAVLCVGMFAVQSFFAGPDGRLGLPGMRTGFEIWNGAWEGLVTSAVLHGGLLHLFFNVGWILFLGRAVELLIKPWGYLLFLVGSALVASTVQLALTDETGIGASGVVCALFGFAWWLRGRVPLFNHLLTPQLSLWVFIWLVACVPLTAMGVLHIANGAHFGGLFFGMLTAEVFFRSRQRLWRQAYALVLGAALLPAVWWPVSSTWQAAAGWRALSNGNADGALRHLTKSGVLTDPGAFLVVVDRIYTETGRHAPERAVEWFDLLEPIAAGHDLQMRAHFYNTLAWYLATAPEEGVRDGARAVVAAEQAAVLTDYRSAAVVDTLAAAHAEAGHFAEAIRWQEAAIALLEVEGMVEELGAEFAERLQLYRAHQPYRESPLGGR